jgi:transcriptional regulator with XRE-family HTH domain
MTSSELTTARLELGFSLAEFAEYMGVSESEVAAWESGKVRIPRPEAQLLSWNVAMKRRDRAIKAARLPECAWANEWDNRPDSDDADESIREQEEWDVQTAACSVCQTRENYLTTHLGPPPPVPMPSDVVVLETVERFVDALPVWSRAPLGGAAVGLAVSLYEWGTGRGVGALGFALFIAGGAVIGLLQWGARELFRRVSGRTPTP